MTEKEVRRRPRALSPETKWEIFLTHRRDGRHTLWRARHRRHRTGER